MTAATPPYADLYYHNEGYSLERGWYTDNAGFHRHWFARIKDVIDKFQPDLLYSDGGVPFGDIGLSIIAHLYNTSAALHGGVNQAVYTQKDTDPQIYTIGVLDIERGQREDIAEHPWQTDTSVGDWFYNVRDVYKTPRQVLETLVDIVSKNGNLVLNIPQKPDGTLDDECDLLLRQMAAWMTANGEGLFGSRPWDVSGEGASAAEAGCVQGSRRGLDPDGLPLHAQGRDGLRLRDAPARRRQDAYPFTGDGPDAPRRRGAPARPRRRALRADG